MIDGAKATLLLNLEQQLAGRQVGVPRLHLTEVAGPTTAPTVTQTGVAATGTITCVAKADMVDGETLTISDGTNTKVFEFDVNGTGVTAGRVQVDVSSDTSAADIAARLTTAINGVTTGLLVTATDNLDGTIDLENDGTGSVGNATISDTVANAGFTHTGMAGGVGLVTGAVSYAYCRVTIDRGLTELSSWSTPASVTRDKIRLTALVWSADANVDGLAIFRKVGSGSAVHIGTIWDSTHATTTFDDNTASGSEAPLITAPTANETANNWGLQEIPIDPVEVVKRVDVQVTPNTLTGSLYVSEPVQIRADHTFDFSSSLMAGHLVPLWAAQLGLPTVTRDTDTNIRTYEFTGEDESDYAVSLGGIYYKGSTGAPPALFQGLRIAETEIEVSGTTDLNIKAKGSYCSDTFCSPGSPAVGNGGSTVLAPVLRGQRADATADTDDIIFTVTSAPTDGEMKGTFQIGSGGAAGPETTIYYDTSTKRIIRYGHLDEPSVEIFVGADGISLGADESRNLEPVCCTFPGDIDTYALSDVFTFAYRIPVPDSRVATYYSGQARLWTEQSLFTPGRVRIMRGLSAANDWLECDIASLKITRSITPRMGFGRNHKRSRDMILSGPIRVSIELTRYVDSLEFEKYARGGKSLVVEALFEGPRIWTNPGVRDAAREQITVSLGAASVGQKYTASAGAWREVITFQATAPRDVETPFSAEIITGMGWNFDDID